MLVFGGTNIDTLALPQPLPGDNPCGPNLEYDPGFQAMEAAVDVVDVDWREVRSMAEDLCVKTKDLRIGAQLARAVLATDGLVEFAGMVDVIREWQGLYWSDLHPELEDPAEGLPQPRISALSVLTTKDPNPEKQNNSTPRLLRSAALVSGKLGSVSLRDYELANKASDEAPDSDDGSEADAGSKSAAPGLSSIAALFSEESAVGSSRAAYAAVLSLMDSFTGISQICTEHFGYSEGLNTDDITKTLIEMKAVLERFGDVVPVSENDSENADEIAESASARQGGVPGEINTREDAIQALDRVCSYFEKSEPSSPVPFMLRRAKKLISKSFLEVLQELTPEAVDSAQHIIGSDQD